MDGKNTLKSATGSDVNRELFLFTSLREYKAISTHIRKILLLYQIVHVADYNLMINV